RQARQALTAEADEIADIEPPAEIDLRRPQRGGFEIQHRSDTAAFAEQKIAGLRIAPQYLDMAIVRLVAEQSIQRGVEYRVRPALHRLIAPGREPAEILIQPRRAILR